MRLLAIALIISLSLAGCADNAEDPEPTADDPTGGGSGDGGSDEPTGDDGNVTTEGNNTAPIATLTADTLNGTAPLMVNFTLEGSDADGDNLTWTVTVNGTEQATGDMLPAAFNFTFGEGNHTIELTVSDGLLTHAANVTVSAVAGEAPDLGPCGGEPEPCIIEDHPWVTVWSDGRCDAKNAIGNEAGGWIHDRPGSEILGEGNPAGGDWPLGTGYLSGGGTWLYEESNGIDGLQLNDNVSGINGALGNDGFAAGLGCTGGDTMMF